MIFPSISSLLCAIIIIANIEGYHCQNTPGENSAPTGGITDQEGENDYHDQFISKVMKKFDKIDRQLMEIEKWQNETDQKLKAVFVNKDRNNSETGLPIQDSFNQSESPFILDASTLPVGRGTIVFKGKRMSPRPRRFWVMEKAGTVEFTLETNDLKPECRLTISGFKDKAYNSSRPTSDYLDEVYIKSSTAVGTEFTVSGFAILVTMTCNYIVIGTRVNSSFGLRFFRSQNDTVLYPGRNLYPTTLEIGEEQRVASFTHGNAVNYTNLANHFMLISRPSGRSFTLTRTYLDTESGFDYYSIFEIDDEGDKARSSLRGIDSGAYGRSNIFWGRYSTAVVLFRSDHSKVGKGYEMTIETENYFDFDSDLD